MTPQPQRRHTQAGFSLIELIVVILILGILATIAIPIMMNNRRKGVDASMKSDIRGVSHQLEAHYTRELTYPLDVEGSVHTQAFPIADETQVITPGNSVKIVFGTGDALGQYAICAWNVNGNAISEANAWVYNSARGGFIREPSACPTPTTI